MEDQSHLYDEKHGILPVGFTFRLGYLAFIMHHVAGCAKDFSLRGASEDTSVERIIFSCMKIELEKKVFTTSNDELELRVDGSLPPGLAVQAIVQSLGTEWRNRLLASGRADLKLYLALRTSDTVQMGEGEMALPG